MAGNELTLDFVILQPVTLTNDEEVTSIQLIRLNEKASKTITRSTVAAVLCRSSGRKRIFLVRL